MLKHIKVLNVCLLVFIFSLPANLYSTEFFRAFSKLLGIEREKKEYTDEFIGGRFNCTIYIARKK